MAYTVLLIANSIDDRSRVALAFVRAAPRVRLCMALNQEEAQACLLGTEAYADRDAYPIPQLILLDLDLPGKTGFEVLKWLKAEARFRPIPVIALASSADSSDADRAYALGANCCLLKTVNEEELKDIARGIGDYATLLKSSLSRGLESRRIQIHPPQEEPSPNTILMQAS